MCALQFAQVPICVFLFASLEMRAIQCFRSFFFISIYIIINTTFYFFYINSYIFLQSTIFHYIYIYFLILFSTTFSSLTLFSCSFQGLYFLIHSILSYLCMNVQDNSLFYSLVYVYDQPIIKNSQCLLVLVSISFTQLSILPKGYNCCEQAYYELSTHSSADTYTIKVLVSPSTIWKLTVTFMFYLTPCVLIFTIALQVTVLLHYQSPKSIQLQLAR